MIGQIISHYRVLEKLGEGGMGEVYLAEDTSLDRKVALKFLPESLQQDVIAHKRLIREAKSAAALDHPFICNIYEVSQTEDGRDFICMEYVRGETLQAVMAEGPLFLKDALKIAAEIAEALEQAHSQSIVHRDLKPANIMLTPEGHAKVMDFGIAKRVPRVDGTEQDVSTRMTTEESTIGTLAYMSPEQLRGAQVDTRTDVFSFGILIYEMLTGVHPFRRAQTVDTTSAILKEDPPALTRYQEDLSEVLQHTVRRMLAKSLDERYQSVREVRTDLVEELSRLSSFDTAPYAHPTPSRTSPFAVGLVALGLVIVAVLIYWNWEFLKKPPESQIGGRNSIAVLPFDNLSPDEDDWFADGITEDITTEISKIGDLTVIARTSAFRYKNTKKSLRAVADELGVAVLLEGSVRRAEGRIRIVAQLIEAQTETHLWAESYDREEEHVFAIQSDVAQQIATALKATLSPDEKNRIESKPTGNTAAYNLYLQGRFFRSQEVDGAIGKAVKCYEQAIVLDPYFALAYAGLAESGLIFWTNLVGVTETPEVQEWREKAESAARTALALDASLPEAHLALGVLLQFFHYDWSGAERELKRALQLNPHHPYALREYGLLLRRMGRHEESIVELRKAQELDPVSWIMNYNLGLAYLRVGIFDEAQNLGEKLVELYPTHFSGHHLLSDAYLGKGLFEEALQFEGKYWELRQLEGPDLETAYIYARVGRKSEARQILTEALASPNPRLWQVTELYAALGENDEAFRSMERWPINIPVWLLNAGWRLEPLRSDPRFAEHLRRINLEPKPTES